jgi:hypothetical protein
MALKLNKSRATPSEMLSQASIKLDSLRLALLGFKRNEILLRDYSSRSSPRTTEGRGVIPVFRIQATLGKHPRVFLLNSREFMKGRHP